MLPDLKNPDPSRTAIDQFTISRTDLIETFKVINDKLNLVYENADPASVDEVARAINDHVMYMRFFRQRVKDLKRTINHERRMALAENEEAPWREYVKEKLRIRAGIHQSKEEQKLADWKRRNAEKEENKRIWRAGDRERWVRILPDSEVQRVKP